MELKTDVYYTILYTKSGYFLAMIEGLISINQTKKPPLFGMIPQ